jgi:hypothetical protein
MEIATNVPVEVAMTTSRKNPAKQSAKAYAVRRPHEAFYVLEGWPDRYDACGLAVSAVRIR